MMKNAVMLLYLLVGVLGIGMAVNYNMMADVFAFKNKGGRNTAEDGARRDARMDLIEAEIAKIKEILK